MATYFNRILFGSALKLLRKLRFLLESSQCSMRGWLPVGSGSAKKERGHWVSTRTTSGISDIFHVSLRYRANAVGGGRGKRHHRHFYKPMWVWAGPFWVRSSFVFREEATERWDAFGRNKLTGGYCPNMTPHQGLRWESIGVLPCLQD